MKIRKSPAKIAAWSLAVIATTYFLGSAISILRLVGTERINRRTQISLESSEIELNLTLPKGMWRISLVNTDEHVSGTFKVTGESCNANSSGSSDIIFKTDKDFTDVNVKCKFEGDVSGHFLEIAATF